MIPVCKQDLLLAPASIRSVASSFESSLRMLRLFGSQDAVNPSLYISPHPLSSVARPRHFIRGPIAIYCGCERRLQAAVDAALAAIPAGGSKPEIHIVSDLDMTSPESIRRAAEKVNAQAQPIDVSGSPNLSPITRTYQTHLSTSCTYLGSHPQCDGQPVCRS